MIKPRITILGSTGFVGKNLCTILADRFEIIQSSRHTEITKESGIFFDLCDTSSWQNILDCKPDYIINCIGYGVVRLESVTDQMFQINYNLTADFFDFLFNSWTGKLIHIGTAFEYDLTTAGITESTPELPKTNYGISKLMASHYLMKKYSQRQFIILRPFNMFGAHEDNSKIIPALITSLKNKQYFDLSDGNQKRDYFFINDFCEFIATLISKWSVSDLPKIINVGSGETISIRSIASLIDSILPGKDENEFWRWGVLPKRTNESEEFYNASLLCSDLGFKRTELPKALQQTIKAY